MFELRVKQCFGFKIQRKKNRVLKYDFGNEKKMIWRLFDAVCKFYEAKQDKNKRTDSLMEHTGVDQITKRVR